MANRRLATQQPASFAFTADNLAWIEKLIARYPEGRQASAVIPMLWRAQEQEGWISEACIRWTAERCGLTYVRVYEIVTFYTMFHLAPVGRTHVQVCGTTPCLLRGSDDVMAACKNRGMTKGKTTPDGLFTLTEVECMGTCTNAPMVQINDDNYEDLDYDRMTAILEALADGKQPKVGTQEPGRHSVEPAGALSTLKDMVSENHDYRKEW